MVVETKISNASLQEAVAKVAHVIQQHRDEGERDRRLPAAIIDALRGAGLFRLMVPHEYGGAEIDLPLFMETIESIARLDGATGWTYANLATGGVLTALLPPASARAIFANSPDLAHSGSVIPRGRAIAVPGGYRLSGRWPLASGCHHADSQSAVATVFDGDTPRMGPHGAPDFKVMFFSPREAQILDTWDSVGLRGTGSADFVVNDLFIPEERVFSMFSGPPRVSGPLYSAGVLPLFAMALSSVLLGIARDALDSFVELAKGKTPTLSKTGLVSRPTIHADVAKAEALLQSARAYLFQVAEEMMASLRLGNGVPEDLEAKRRLACVNAGAATKRVVDTAFDLAGSTPVYSGNRIERCLRDIHTAGQHLVFSPVWWEKTGQSYFGLGLGMP